MSEFDTTEEDLRPTFVVVWESTIGREKEDGSQHDPVNLSFITTIRAADKEEAQNGLLTYSDPTFVLRVQRIEELDEDMSRDELIALLEHNTVFNIPEKRGEPVKADRD